MPKTPDLDVFPPIDVAALAVVTSLGEWSLAEGTSERVIVPRALINDLRAALQDSYPGVVDFAYLQKRRSERRAS